MIDSPFDPEKQINSTESKIVVALERISEAFRVLLWNESKENSLSPIQIQMLIFLHFHSREFRKVSYLASEFNMTKATISDSIKMMVKKGLLEKIQDEQDARSYYLNLTEESNRIIERASLFSKHIEHPLNQFSDRQKEILLSSLLELIHKLHLQGIISIQRMCLTCQYYKRSADTHFCKLLKKPLLSTELRIDCPEHKLKT